MLSARHLPHAPQASGGAKRFPNESRAALFASLKWHSRFTPNPLTCDAPSVSSIDLRTKSQIRMYGASVVPTCTRSLVISTSPQERLNWVTALGASTFSFAVLASFLEITFASASASGTQAFGLNLPSKTIVAFVNSARTTPPQVRRHSGHSPNSIKASPNLEELLLHEKSNQHYQLRTCKRKHPRRTWHSRPHERRKYHVYIPASCACRSAWYELLTIAPIAAWRNPIAPAWRSNMAKASGCT